MGAEALVFHRGALGDSVLLWPRLKRLAVEGFRVCLVTDGEKGRLASRVLGIDAADAESPRFRSLWVEGVALEAAPSVALVENYLGARGSTFDRNLRRMFPAARIECPALPRADHARAETERAPHVAPGPRCNPNGPIVLHVGAGSELKRWPLERFAALGAILSEHAWALRYIAGEVERERLGPRERSEFARLGGAFIDTLEELEGVLSRAALVVGCDSGPTHLSAQLGLPTLAVFGPTDPTLWGPVGPCVEVIRAQPWAEAREVAAAAHQLGRRAGIFA